MTNVVALDRSTDTEQQAIAKLRERFVRVPSKTPNPAYRDLLTGIVQSDPGVLLAYYRKQGGTKLKEGAPLPLTVVMGDSFLPGAPRILSGDLLNLWTPPDLQPSGARVTKEQVAPFVEFMERWFPVQEERKYMWQWIAHAVRYPHHRITTTPLLRSDHGTGKGFFAEYLMAGLLGEKSVANTGLKTVVGDFNEILEGRTFVVIDELYKDGTATANALKSIQGNQTISLNRKHQPVVTIKNYINFIVTSNDTVPLDLEPDDRRFWVPQFIKHKVDGRETAHFINATLRPWLGGGGFQLVRDYLEQLNLTDFYPTSPAPMTPSKQEMIGLNPKEELAEFVADQIADAHGVKAADIVLAYRLDTEQDVSQPAVTKELLNKGCKKKRTDRGALWITPKGLEAGLSPTSPAGELHKAYGG